MPSRPFVVITGRRHLGRDRGEAWPRRSYTSPNGYADAVARAGGRPLVLPPVTGIPVGAREWLDGVDGLVLTGGPDVDPARYGERPHPSVYGLDAAVDEHEAGMLRVALEAGLPVLAVCRGAQLLNVVLGGSLVQHLPEPPGGLDHGGPVRRAAEHHVTIDEGTRLAEAVGATEATVWSIHHQAIDRLGTGLRVTARAPDGTIEAVEPDDPTAPWVVGVQWHPEGRADVDPFQQRLFDAFVEHADRQAGVRASAAALRS
ncbi:MAG: gamma-glutamyl-gamma-aminobutyrate hydrolase family protein [Acidimicrobiales bacterium]